MGKSVKVKSVVEADPNNLSINPILVRFEHATVNPDLNASVDLHKVFGAAVFASDTAANASRDMSHLNRSSFASRSLIGTKDQRGTKRKQVVALQTDSMTYIGTKGFDNPQLLSPSDDMLKTYIAIKRKKKMRLYEVTPITVSPFLKGYSHVVEKGRDTGIEKSKEEKREAAVDLIKSFGSKRKRLTHERIEKNKIDISDMQTSIDAAIETLDVPQNEPKMTDQSVLTLIPPCDRGASFASEVYKLEQILSNDELDAMDDLLETFFSASGSEIKDWKASKKHSDYFCAMLNKLQPRQNDPRAKRNGKIVLYTELLITFLKLKHDQVRRKIVPFPEEYPMWLREKVLDNFTTMNANGTRNRPDAYKDKACCYIMVLVLLANDLHFDVQLMSTSLNIHIKKLLTLAKAVGITLTYNPTTKDHRGVLKLPLPKPIENRGRRRALR